MVMKPAELKNKRIGVLMGGLSREREVSLRSGSGCLEALTALGYDAVGIDVDREAAPTLGREGVEVAFLALHGKFGEDGAIQGLLELLGIPYTGSRVLASATGMNKVRTKQVAAWYGIATPAFAIFDGVHELEAATRDAAARLRFPVMVKPCEEGSSLGVAKVESPDRLAEVVHATHGDFGPSLAEEFVEGDEVTVGLLESEDELTALPVLQLVPGADFYDFHSKYSEGGTRFIVPAELPEPVCARTRELAAQVHRALGCRGFSRVDFIIGADGAPQLTEINTIPGMTATSDLPAQAAAAGIGYEELVERMLTTAMLP
ncbi:MAG: D-alanine--D-alanine ligase [Actinomycetota bacterium]|jgi:D-alanine-D-alanine ligase|nr:D-alanine--D-alanine ligase [Actinomycetota bacterium]MDA8167605.1 D-alanine--D-alanine ligase [Actinomycetota bacterium]